ncbi:DUF4089 domain-containing protein [Piscinibacter gummiphilus]|uniref:DUF4089 domain-containing protein n=1 Tax=Piscinibacter gummiphilus TaxID=946333 RepID=A0ABZ0CWT9_9BURK|nr:DUF4089 domain-containing protein [Piscinibacter gummiphilus]WOB09368.1 DUF4089 domain-containing protein [Piscinibacter gummiphilus]
MTTTTQEDIEHYVRSAAQMASLPLADAQVQRVAVHLARTKALAESLLAFPLPDDTEPAEVYCPAPFPPGRE